MANRRMQIHRLHRVAACQVNAVEILGQLEQILETAAGADLLAIVQIIAVRWRGDIAEHDVLAADGDPPVGVAGRDGERFGGEFDHFHDEVTPHADIGAIDGASRLFQNGGRFGVQELDADLFQHPHGTVMDGLDSFLVKGFGRPVGVDRYTPIHLVDGSARTALQVCPVAPAPPTGSSGHAAPAFATVSRPAMRPDLAARPMFAVSGRDLQVRIVRPEGKSWVSWRRTAGRPATSREGRQRHPGRCRQAGPGPGAMRCRSGHQP